MIPTVGFNMRKVTKGNVTIKARKTICVLCDQSFATEISNVLSVELQLWDIGGQPRFRSMWERYCRGVSCIV